MNMNNQEIFNDVYSNIILESYSPLQGGGITWNVDTFKKLVIKMMKKGFKNKDLYKEFDGFFVSSKLFSFKDIFKIKPNIIANGEGDKLEIKVSFLKDMDDKDSLLLTGGSITERHLFKKNIKKDETGILHNKSFLVKFGEIDIYNNENDGNSSLKTWKGGLSNIFSGKWGLVFDFTHINYIKEIKKRKDKVNPNYIQSFVGNIYLTFTVGGKEILVDLEDGTEEKLMFNPRRYESMNPGSFFKDQLKDAWHNSKPDQGFGLLGQLTKKAITKGINGNVIQEEEFEFPINNKYGFDQANSDPLDNDKDNDKENNNDDTKESPDSIIDEDEIVKIINGFSNKFKIGHVEITSTPDGDKLICSFIHDKTSTEIFKIGFMLK